jgi:hypothetical protein
MSLGSQVRPTPHSRSRALLPSLAVALALLLVTVLWFERVTLRGEYFLHSDVVNISLPLKVTFIQALRASRWPLWNPMLGCGFPQLAESQTAVFYPASLLLALFVEPAPAFHLNIAFHLWLAALLTYAFGRQLGLTRAASFFMGLAFAFGGFLMAHRVHEFFFAGAAWTPLELLLVDRSIVRRSKPARFWLAPVVALHLFAGHFQLAFMSLLVAATYSLVRATVLARRRDRVRAVAAIAGACAVGFLLAAVQLLPTWEFRGQSVRQANIGWGPTFGSLPPPNLLGLAFPAIWAPSHWPLEYWTVLKTTPEECLGYVGLAPLFAALWAMRGLAAGCPGRQATAGGGKNGDSPFDVCSLGPDPVFRSPGRPQPTRPMKDGLRPLLWFWTIAAVLGMLFALGRFGPLSAVLTEAPGFNLFRAPGRWLFVTSISLAVLAGIGFDSLVQSMVDRGVQVARWVVRYSLALGLAAGLVVGPATLIAVFARDHLKALLPFIREHWPRAEEFCEDLVQDLTRDPMFPVWSAVVPLLLISSLLAIVLIGRRRPRLLAPLLALHAAMDLTVYASLWSGPSLSPRLLREPSPVATYLTKHGSGRVLAVPQNVPPLLGRPGTLYESGFRLAPGCLLDQRIARLAFTTRAGEAELGMVRVTATEHLLCSTEELASDLPPGDAIADPRGARLFNWPEKVHLIRLDKSVPRARLTRHYLIVPKQERAIEQLADPTFDPHETVILDQPPPTAWRRLAWQRGQTPTTTVAPETRTGDAVRIVADEPDRVVVRVDDAPQGFLVLADTIYPGWEARVDGQAESTPILCADTKFRAVPLAAGSHTVEFTYHPRWFSVGWRVSVVTLALWVGAWSVVALRRAGARRHDLPRRPADEWHSSAAIGRSPRADRGYSSSNSVASPA